MTAVAVFFNPSLICLSVFNKDFSLADKPMFIGLFRLAYWAGLAGPIHGFAASHTTPCSTYFRLPSASACTSHRHATNFT